MVTYIRDTANIIHEIRADPRPVQREGRAAPLGETVDEVAGIGPRGLLQTVLEAEVAELLGRNR